jgi:hypothetical protein
MIMIMMMMMTTTTTLMMMMMMMIETTHDALFQRNSALSAVLMMSPLILMCLWMFACFGNHRDNPWCNLSDKFCIISCDDVTTDTDVLFAFSEQQLL